MLMDFSIVNIVFLLLVFVLLNFWSWRIPLTNDEASFIIPEILLKNNMSNMKNVRLFLAVFHNLKKVFKDKLDYKWIRIITYVLIFSTSIFTYYLAQVILPYKIALVVALIFILLTSYPPLLLFNISAEQMENFFVVLGMLFCFWGLKNYLPVFLFFGGIFFSCSLIITLKAVPHIFCLPFTLLVYFFFFEFPFEKLLIFLFYYVGGFMAILLPFLIYSGGKNVASLFKFLWKMKEMNKANYGYYFGNKPYFDINRRLFFMNFLPILPFVIYGLFVCSINLRNTPYYVLLLFWFSSAIFVILVQKIACWVHPYIMVPSVTILAGIGIEKMLLSKMLFLVSSSISVCFLILFVWVGFFDKKSVHSYSRFSQYDINKKCYDCGKSIVNYLIGDRYLFVFGPFPQIHLFSNGKCFYPPLLYLWFPDSEDIFDFEWEKKFIKVLAAIPPNIIVVWRDWLPIIDWTIFTNELGLEYEKLFPDDFCDGYFSIFRLIKKHDISNSKLPDKFTIRKKSYLTILSMLKENNLNRILIFGTGSLGKFTHSIVKKNKFEILGFMDSSEKKWGKNLLGKKIFSYSEVKNLNYDAIIIGSVFVKEIQEILQQNGFVKNIISFQ